MTDSEILERQQLDLDSLLAWQALPAKTSDETIAAIAPSQRLLERAVAYGARSDADPSVTHALCHMATRGHKRLLDFEL